MKKTIFTSLVLLFLSGFVLQALRMDSRNPGRMRYEAFLRDQAKGISGSHRAGGEDADADQPEMAALQNFMMTVDPAIGRVPHERLLKAYEETRALRMQKTGTDALQWTNVPSNMGGRTRAIMFDPNDPQLKKVWAGGVTGGLWYNSDITNPSSSWIPVGDFWPCLAIRCITYDPNNTQVLYIGTGEAETAIEEYRESSGLGDGIWKSTDGGQTWNVLPSTAGFAYVTDIAVRNEGGNSVLYAGVVSGVYQGIHQSTPSDGLFRSADGGTTWEQVLPNITGLSVPYAPSDISITADGTRIIVGTRPNLNGDGAATLLYSDSGTTGSWTINDSVKNVIESETDHPVPGRVVLACAPSDPNVVYALFASGYVDASNNFDRFNCWHIIRSANKGVTWVNKNLPYDNNGSNNFASIAWHALDIAVDPNDANTVYIGGLDVQKTTDGGTYWNRVSDWSLMYGGGGNQYIHADQHIIVYKPGSSTEILFGSDGGVFFTANGTADYPIFKERDLDYNTLQFYSCALRPEWGSQECLGGLQDNGSLYYVGLPLSEDNMVSGGDGAYSFFDQNEPNYYISSIYYNYYIVYDDGSQVNNIGDFSGSGIFVNPADYDYRANAIYANGVDFIASVPDKYLQIKNVTAYGGYTGTFKNAGTGSPVYFSAVKWSPNSPANQATLFLGTVSGRLFKLTHAESSPVTTEITGPDFPNGNISCIDVGNSDDTLAVTFSNYGVPSVWQSYDGGQTWADKEGNLPDMPVRWILYYPGHSGHALLGTETGVWSTSNLNQSNVVWSPDVSGMANVRTDMLNFRPSDNAVLAATQGRGLFTATWDVVSGIPHEKSTTIRIYPNPTSGPVYLDGNFNGSSGVKIRICDLQGKTVMENHSGPDLSGSNRITDLSTLPNGVYFVEISENGKSILTNRIIKTN